MQVDPALPWDNTVEGGTIQLRDPLTLQQLLDGALDVVLKDGHDELVEGSFEIYPSDSKLYLGGNSLDYCITNVDTSASSTVYSELILEKTLSAGEKLHSVSIHVPDVIVSPSLPWSSNINRGSINLKTPLTADMLVSGALEISIDHRGSIDVARFDYFGNQLYIIESGDAIYQVTNYDKTQPNKLYSNLELELANENKFLYSIEVTKSILTPRAPWKESTEEGLITLPVDFPTGVNDLNSKLKAEFAYKPQGSTVYDTAWGKFVSDTHLFFGPEWDEIEKQYEVTISTDANAKYLRCTKAESYQNHAYLKRAYILLPDGFYSNSRGFVIKVVDYEVYPVYARQRGEEKEWYEIVNGGLSTYTGGSTISERIKVDIESLERDYSGDYAVQNDYYIDEEGVLDSDLNISDIKIL